MANDNLRQRHQPTAAQKPDAQPADEKSKSIPHPAGEIKHGAWKQTIRASLLLMYLTSSLLSSVYPNTKPSPY